MCVRTKIPSLKNIRKNIFINVKTFNAHNAVLTWLFGRQSQLRVQIGAVFRIYPPFILLSSAAHTVQSNTWCKGGDKKERQHLLFTHHFITNTTSSIKQADNVRCHFKSTASGAGRCEPAINGTTAVSGHFRDVDRRWPAADRQGHSHSLHVTSGHAPAHLPLVACVHL